MRLFVGLPLPDEIRLGLSQLCSGLAGVRWVAPENFHITLRFIGEVDSATADDIDAALCGVRAPTFTLELAGVGHFGDDTKVHAVWAGVRPQAALQHLRDEVGRAVAPVSAATSSERFVPHVTGARRNRPPPRSDVHSFLAQHEPYRSQRFDVTHFTLYSSVSGSNGPRYRPEHSYALAASG